MISFITNSLRRMRDVTISRHYGSGFEYGAGALLQGVSPDLLGSEAEDMMLHPQSVESEAFNAGVAAACREWKRRVTGC